MHRLIVLILAAVDALVAAAVGVAAVLAPLTLLWLAGFGLTADWDALWPAGAAIWQLGHLVPQAVTLPDDYLAAAGIDPALGAFAISLAPLALAGFTALFAVRSGARAAASGAGLVGVVAGGVVFAGLTVLVALTSGSEVVHAETWQAMLLPSLVYVLPLALGAGIAAWRGAETGPIARLRARAEALPGTWARVPAEAARGAGIVLAGLVGLGGLFTGLAILLRGGEIVALTEAAHVDALGATVLALGQAAYLPTLIAWAIAFLAGPGIAVGVDTAVSPAGTQLGVVPGIPILGVLPESTSGWMLLLVLLPVGVGVVAGWVVRSRLVAAGSGHEQAGPRLAIAGVLAVVAGGAGALLAVLSSGSIGPGRLAEVGPAPGPLALSLGLEVLVGAAILLLSPRRADAETPEPARWRADADGSADDTAHADAPLAEADAAASDAPRPRD